MARYRMIKPEFWEDDKIAECSPIARLLFVALWNFADDEGYIEYRSKWLKAKCLPYDDANIDELLAEIEAAGRIEIRGDVIWIKNFLKHQKIDKPKPSNLSQLFKNSTNVRRQVDDESSRLYINKDKLNKDKINKNKLNEDKEREEDGGKNSASPTPAETMKEFCEMVENKLDEYHLFVQKISQLKKLPPKYVREELEKFVNYWREKTLGGQKELWETKKTFEVQRRLMTWFLNASRFSGYGKPQDQPPTRIR